jgi:hypothetical protein
MPQTYLINKETMEKLWTKKSKGTFLESIGGYLDKDKLARELGIKNKHISQIWVNENGRKLGLPDHPTAQYNKEMENYWGKMTVKGSLIVVLTNHKDIPTVIKLNTVDDITDF